MTAKLVPELNCTDFERSLTFYTDVLGFKVRYARPEQKFAYLEREGAELMLEGLAEVEDPGRTYHAGLLEYPFGRGMHLQIEVSDLGPLHQKVLKSGARIQIPLEERWYRADDLELGNRQFVLLDPDGFVLRFFESLGSRPFVEGRSS